MRFATSARSGRTANSKLLRHGNNFSHVNFPPVFVLPQNLNDAARMPLRRASESFGKWLKIRALRKDSLKLEAGRKGRRVQRIGQLQTRRQCVFRDGNRLPDRGITNVDGASQYHSSSQHHLNVSLVDGVTHSHRGSRRGGI